MTNAALYDVSMTIAYSRTMQMRRHCTSVIGNLQRKLFAAADLSNRINYARYYVFILTLLAPIRYNGMTCAHFRENFCELHELSADIENI